VTSAIDESCCTVLCCAGDHAACEPAGHLASSLHSWCGAAKACGTVQVGEVLLVLTFIQYTFIQYLDTYSTCIPYLHT
jgi:hypothetical protein